MTDGKRGREQISDTGVAMLAGVKKAVDPKNIFGTLLPYLLQLFEECNRARHMTLAMPSRTRSSSCLPWLVAHGFRDFKVCALRSTDAQAVLAGNGNLVGDGQVCPECD